MEMQKQPPEVFCKKRLQTCNFIKKETLAQVFSCEFCEILRKSFSLNASWRLLLEMEITFSRHLLVRRQRLKYQNNARNLFKANSEDTRSKPMTSILMFLFLILRRFHKLSWCFLRYVEQVNTSWVIRE